MNYSLNQLLGETRTLQAQVNSWKSRFSNADAISFAKKTLSYLNDKIAILQNIKKGEPQNFTAEKYNLAGLANLNAEAIYQALIESHGPVQGYMQQINEALQQVRNLYTEISAWPVVELKKVTRSVSAVTAPMPKTTAFHFETKDSTAPVSHTTAPNTIAPINYELPRPDVLLPDPLPRPSTGTPWPSVQQKQDEIQAVPAKKAPVGIIAAGVAAAVLLLSAK